MINTKIVFCMIAALSLLGFGLYFFLVLHSSELDELILSLKEDYDVPNISNQQLHTIPSESVLMFDVRKLDEYQVSHIEHAIHLDPSISKADFLQQYGSELKDKTVVFYCSVGLRSSSMLARLAEELATAGVQQAYNLEGGVFKRHNDNISLTRAGQITRDIHPYNAYWGRLIEDKASIKYQ